MLRPHRIDTMADLLEHLRMHEMLPTSVHLRTGAQLHEIARVAWHLGIDAGRRQVEAAPYFRNSDEGEWT
jgi:hypothetical protein